MTSVALLVTLVMTLWASCEADFTVTLLHTNDIHARYDQFNKYGSTCSDSDADEGNCFGGYARLKTEVDRLRQQNPNSLLLDGGDQYQGTLWFYKYSDSVTSYFANWIGFDAMAIGNHEFDNGVSGLVPFLQKATFNVLSANIDVSEEPTMAGLFNKSTERMVAGHRVGIIGYTTVDTPRISSPGKVQFNDVITSVRQEVERLRSDGVKVIIALGHAGFTVDQQVAQIPGVDVVVGGHTNTFLYTGTPPSDEVPAGDYPTVVERGVGGKALVVQCFTWAKYLCVLNVTFNNNGDIVSYGGNPILLDNSVPQDNATLAELAPWKQGVQNLSSEVVGRTLVKLEGSRQVCRKKECNLGNLIADGMIYQNLRHPDELRWNDVSIALVNAGGIRASIARGDITVGDLISVQPFGNTIDAMQIKGRHLKEALEYCASNVDPCQTEDLFGGFLQVSGLRVQYDLKQAAGQRVASVQALCTSCEVPEFEPLQDETVYKVLMSNFIARGGDGYDVFRDKRVNYDPIGDLDSDILIEYVKRESPIYQGLEGRIQFLHDSGICTSSASASVPHTALLLVLASLLLIWHGHRH